MLALGNTALQNGDPQQARRAFESAYGLSTQRRGVQRGRARAAQQSQTATGADGLERAAIGRGRRTTAALGGKLHDLRNSKDANYTQQDAKDIIDNNSADENAAFMRLAEQLIQQQDAAVANPAVIRANIPEQGRLLTFKRAVVVDTWADLNIGLHARTTQGVSWGLRAAVLALVALGLAAFALLARGLGKTGQTG